MSQKTSHLGKPRKKEKLLHQVDPNRRGVGKQADAFPPGGTSRKVAHDTKDHDPVEVTRRRAG